MSVNTDDNKNNDGVVSEPGMVNIVLIDDHELVLNGFVQLIESEPDLRVLGTFANAETALSSGLINNETLVITDISLPGQNGLDFLSSLKRSGLAVKSIILSMYESPHYIATAKELEVKAYLSKRDAGDMLLSAIAEVVKGNTFYSPHISDSLEGQAEEFVLYQGLTEREKEIFILLALGYEVKTVATSLDIAVKTAHVHRRNILNKFSANTGFELTRFAIKYGLIDPAQL